MYNTNTVCKKLKKSKKNQPLINDLSGSPDFFYAFLVYIFLVKNILVLIFSISAMFQNRLRNYY